MTNPDIAKQVAKITLDAFKHGSDVHRKLDEAGLLLTPANKVNMIADALENIAGVLNETQVTQILPPGVPLSAADIKRHIANWIIGIAEQNRQALKR
jgi:hypothetical protein